MMHVSVPIDHTVEFINVTEVSPLISKCQIKVCYVGENRNHTFISKEVATEMGKTLPGCPIVGYYNTENGDFEEHNREVELKDGKFAIIDTTKPYGFVDVNAKVWFQKFLDDGKDEREYLVTEGYIWSGVYPESQRVTEIGNNQSMELEKNSIKGQWAKSLNSDSKFFIINEAIIEKLCILGENFEPCFEGSQVKSHFSLEQEFMEFKNTMFSMINELKEALNEGGSKESMPEVDVTIVEEVTAPVEENAAPVEDEVVVVEEEAIVEETVVEEEVVIEETVEEISEEESEDNSDEINPDNSEIQVEGPQYVLEEIQEYVELQDKYTALENNYNSLLAEVETLREFKLVKERETKKSMIDSFYMLSDEDKKDVCENIDAYSLEDIEAKLAVICVRNKVSFSLNKEEETNEMVFNLETAVVEDGVPAWVKAVKQTESKMN